jgi:hypothetical protein
VSFGTGDPSWADNDPVNALERGLARSAFDWRHPDGDLGTAPASGRSEVGVPTTTGCRLGHRLTRRTSCAAHPVEPVRSPVLPPKLRAQPPCGYQDDAEGAKREPSDLQDVLACAEEPRPAPSRCGRSPARGGPSTDGFNALLRRSRSFRIPLRPLLAQVSPSCPAATVVVPRRSRRSRTR